MKEDWLIRIARRLPDPQTADTVVLIALVVIVVFAIVSFIL